MNKEKTTSISTAVAINIVIGFVFALLYFNFFSFTRIAFYPQTTFEVVGSFILVMAMPFLALAAHPFYLFKRKQINGKNFALIYIISVAIVVFLWVLFRGSQMGHGDPII